MSLLIKPIHSVIPECISSSVDSGRFTLIFRSATAADEFDVQFQVLLKSDEVMSRHCSIYIPKGFESWQSYKSELGVKNLSAYNIQFDSEFTSINLMEKFALFFS